MTTKTLRRLSLVAVVVGPAVAACRGGPPQAAAPASTVARAPAGAATDRNACHLLTHQEVSELAERKVVMADQTEADETSSTCDWELEDGTLAFGLTVHWSGGKERFETWRLAQGLGDAILKQSEGVTASEVVKQGVVPGIGDAAYFSEVLPSLVLQGDTLFELKLSPVPKPGAKFAGLAAKLLAKVRP